MWFMKKKGPQAVDLVWTTKAAKLTGILNATKAPANRDSTILLLSHFQETLAALKDSLASAGVEARAADSRMDPRSVVSRVTEDAEPTAYLALSENILVPQPAVIMQDRPASLEVIVAERYPIEDRDSRVLSFAGACGVYVTHLTLEMEDDSHA